MTLINGCAECDNSIADRSDTNYIDAEGNPALLCGECWDKAEGFVCDCCDMLSADTHEFEQGGHWLTLCGPCEAATRPEVAS